MLLRSKLKSSSKPILSKPLRSDHSIETHRGAIRHSNIIGTSPRDVVATTKDKADFRVHDPTLAEYVSFTPRLVTPVRVFLNCPK